MREMERPPNITAPPVRCLKKILQIHPKNIFKKRRMIFYGRTPLNPGSSSLFIKKKRRVRIENRKGRSVTRNNHLSDVKKDRKCNQIVVRKRKNAWILEQRTTFQMYKK